MNKEQTKEARGVMHHYECGGEIQKKSFSDWRDDGNPLWDWQIYEYRRKPKPITRPWTMEECPVGEVVRDISDDNKYVIISAERLRCRLGGWVEMTSYAEMKCWFVMLDGSPCGITEAQP